MADPLEISLNKALAAGNLQAFDMLYHQYKQAVYRNIYKMVQHTETAEDILQEVFLSLWQNRASIREDKSVAGWLFVVSYHKAISFLKQKLKESLIFQSLPEMVDKIPEQEWYQEEHSHDIQLSMIEDAVSHLPNRKQEVFKLCRFEGKSYEEVALKAGISVTSVKDYLKQSNSFIKNYISEKYADTGAAGLSLFILYLACR